MKIRGDVELGQRSDVGMARTANEDFFGYWESEDDREFDLKGRLVVVCDGMGGHIGGEIASRLAVKTVIESYQSADAQNIVEALRAAVEAANAAVNAESRRQPELQGMGTTMTALVHRRDMVYFGQVGDSRAYLIRGGVMKQMTKDHSLVQQLVDEGLLDPSEMESHPDKNVILRSLGVKPEVDVDVSHVPIADGDMFLVCSDGLSGLVTDPELVQIVNDGTANGGDLNAVCQSLVDKANAYGGHDNITVQILRVHSTTSATTDTAPAETVTQSFSEDEVAASIAAARAEAAARGAAPAPAPAAGAPLPVTQPSMPAAQLSEASGSKGGGGGGGGGGFGKFLFGCILGAALGAGGAFGYQLGVVAAGQEQAAVEAHTAALTAQQSVADGSADLMTQGAAALERGDQARLAGRHGEALGHYVSAKHLFDAAGGPQ